MLRSGTPRRGSGEGDMKYAGIGSRETPEEVLHLMAKMAARLVQLKWLCRSGAARGADSAFEIGVRGEVGASEVSRYLELYLPFPGFNGRHDGAVKRAEPSQEAHQVMLQHHPVGASLRGTVALLQARNSHQILGPFPVSAPDPVRMVICWTADGAETLEQITKGTGGTGQALRIACAHQIPIFNLKNPKGGERIKAFLDSQGGRNG